MPSKPLILIGILLLVLVVPLSAHGWGAELPWTKLIASIAGPGVVFGLYWFYWQGAANEKGRKEAPLLLLGTPAAALVGASLAGGEGGQLATAAIIGFLVGLGVWFFRVA